MSATDHFHVWTRRARLAASVAIALGSTMSAARASHAPGRVMPPSIQEETFPEWPAYLRSSSTHAADPAKRDFVRPASIQSVTTCDDGSPAVPGMLRYEVLHAPNSGATIDLSALTCSRITLSTGFQLSVLQQDLSLQGPGAEHLTIDAAGASRVFNHVGTGTLTISDLTLTNGSYVSATVPRGGCLYSNGSVSLSGSVVSGCTIESSSDFVAANGGGVYARGDLTLSDSTITLSHAFSLNGADAVGGGAAVGRNFKALYSTISHSTAVALMNANGIGGGANVAGNVYLKSATISGNRADFSGGIALSGHSPYSGRIVNSTISDNDAAIAYGGIRSKIPLTIENTTIAFNTHGTLYGGGLKLANATASLQSTIIASNAGSDGPSDLGGYGSAALAANSANNLITSSTLTLPADTIEDCPRLDPLADNGGNTRTHKLRHTSPAIDQGDPGTLTLDQRDAPRVHGSGADVGAVEWQASDRDERLLGDGFDGVCDR